MSVSKPRPKPGDYTGNERLRLIAENETNLAEREGLLALQTEQRIKQDATQIVDYSQGGNTPVVIVDEIVDYTEAPLSDGPDVIDAPPTVIEEAPVQAANEVEVEIVGPSKANETVIIQVIEPLEDFTFGIGNQYSFEPGKKYRVQRELAEHLKDKGWIWHSF